MSILNESITGDPAFARGTVGDGVNFMKDDEGYLSLETKKCSLPIGNCRKCYSLGILHEGCRYCHTKESPSYYVGILLRGSQNAVIHSVYLAYCAKKPMDIPTTMKEVDECKHTRSESDIMEQTDEEIKHCITLEEYCIKVQVPVIPPTVQTRMQQLDTPTRNALFRESMILPDEKSKYFSFRIITRSRAQPEHFALIPTTLQGLNEDPGLV